MAQEKKPEPVEVAEEPVVKAKKAESYIDKINAIREQSLKEALDGAFPNGVPDVLEISPDEQLVYRGLLNRYRQISEKDVLKKKDNAVVTNDGQKYYL